MVAEPCPRGTVLQDANGGHVSSRDPMCRVMNTDDVR